MRANPRTAPENGQRQRWHAATVLLGSCLLLLGQVFDYLKNILVAASHGGTDHILAIYQHSRCSGDARTTDLGLRLLHPEIGRASCRERVERTAAAVALLTK